MRSRLGSIAMSTPLIVTAIIVAFLLGGLVMAEYLWDRQQARDKYLGHDRQHIPEMDGFQHPAGSIGDLDAMVQVDEAVVDDADRSHLDSRADGEIVRGSQVR